MGFEGVAPEFVILVPNMPLRLGGSRATRNRLLSYNRNIFYC